MFSKKPWRSLTLTEKLPAGELHILASCDGLKWQQKGVRTETKKYGNDLSLKVFMRFFLNSLNIK